MVKTNILKSFLPFYLFSSLKFPFVKKKKKKKKKKK